ncbi:hypothetical protein AZE42_05069 [Rhizopogon vesiculosus]|uniref:Tyr recombinase domain-containing protein n=1 Tax=Rhizopogon vesiculosus TaxID=180088 RepID=A0A1J8QHC4_9AGAM|nr:hypothetical protein AZE42_05069 [Rhizopogon vesiculosus]
MDRLLHERFIALGFTLARSTCSSYDSTLASYLEFCRLHQLPITPSPDTFSFYIVWLSSYILPSSVDSYLSGICSKMEDEFPDARHVRKSRLVQRTLAGCKRRHQQPVNRREPLSHTDLLTLYDALNLSGAYDDILFLTMIHVGFATLQRLGELVWPDAVHLQSYSSVSMRHTVCVSDTCISYTLPSSNTDRFGHGMELLVQASTSRNNCVALFTQYLGARDALFPSHPALWLKCNGELPTRSWFLRRLRSILPSPNLGGHSMRVGGATALALAGSTPQMIQAAGRWSSDEFQKYIRVHPFLLQALLHGGGAA